MSAHELVEELRSALSDESEWAVLRIAGEYDPAGGPGSRVFPPTYPIPSNGPPDATRYVLESRVVEGVERTDVLLDSVPSQANRAEEALLAAHRSDRVRLPLMELRHDGAADVVLTSLEFPHRYADAYLRDSLVDGVAFDRSDVGRKVLASSLADARGLYAHDPGSLVYGAWNSHRKGRQQKFPRIYASEVVGWDPVEGRRKAGRMDPMNLVGAVGPGGADGEWDFVAAGEKVKGSKLSEIGHGNVAPNPQHGGVTITSATRMATLSTAALRRIGFGTAPVEAQLAARVALAAYALLADRLAFAGPSLWLRSGCELVLRQERLEWVSRGGTTETREIPVPVAVEAFAIAAARAADTGLPMETQTLVLRPKPALAKALDFSLTKAESSGD
ncbi:MAG: type I-U CRISPR-associated RAMP protein Csb1/Cas7u [Kineosporiaceae bacterium]